MLHSRQLLGKWPENALKIVATNGGENVGNIMPSEYQGHYFSIINLCGIVSVGAKSF